MLLYCYNIKVTQAAAPTSEDMTTHTDKIDESCWVSTADLHIRYNEQM